MESSQLILPKGRATNRPVKKITGERKILFLSDIHIPYHDRAALEIAITANADCDTIFLNGDIFDVCALSFHERDPEQRARFSDEIEETKAFLKALREFFPKAEIFFNEGNHELRLPRYISRNSPEMYNLEALEVKNILKLDMFNIEYLPTKTKVFVGKLPVLHGHEYRGGGGVMVGRTMFLKTGTSVILGHFHRTNDYLFRNLKNETQGVFAVGCLCDLSPEWLLENNWNHGYAVVHLSNNGSFKVENRMIIDREVF